MEIQEHIRKAQRISSSLTKCSAEDYEARIEGAMLSATHWFNAALHTVDIRTVQHDVMHGTKLTVEEHKRCETLLGPLLEALDVIEELRSPYVRGAQGEGAKAGELAMEKLKFIAVRTREVIQGKAVF